MNTNPFTRLQESVLLEIKGRTKKNPITGAELTSLYFVIDRLKTPGSNIRKVINTLRDKLMPICASSRGYYFPSNLKELNEYIDSFQGRIYEQQQACNHLRIARENWQKTDNRIN